ncbi:hypothetical protein FB451DRAFT_1553956 [Mycena latifolia]|nr:hypothetical protein FB451DRAFT_1553956 [Mycena latifolia]
MRGCRRCCYVSPINFSVRVASFQIEPSVFSCPSDKTRVTEPLCSCHNTLATIATTPSLLLPRLDSTHSYAFYLEMDGRSARPQTTHVLKHDQRVRLMRSTRKVGALLGETPLFIDPSSPQNTAFPDPRAPARQPAYIYAPNPRSSSLPNGQLYASTSRAAARPLLAVRVAALDEVDSPLTSASSLSFPVFPASPADEQRRQRTRKMARIVRTLGENVPAELVFPPPPPRSILRHPSAAGDRSPAPRPRRTSTLSKRRSSRRLRAGSSASSYAGAVAEEPAEESDSESASVYSTLSGGDWLSVPRPPPAPPAASAPAPSAPPIGYDRGTHRTERGWSGEWVAAAGTQMQNMDDVARKLRDLRLR